MTTRLQANGKLFVYSYCTYDSWHTFIILSKHFRLRSHHLQNRTVIAGAHAWPPRLRRAFTRLPLPLSPSLRPQKSSSSHISRYTSKASRLQFPSGVNTYLWKVPSTQMAAGEGKSKVCWKDSNPSNWTNLIHWACVGWSDLINNNHTTHQLSSVSVILMITFWFMWLLKTCSVHDITFLRPISSNLKNILKRASVQRPTWCTTKGWMQRTVWTVFTHQWQSWRFWTCSSQKHRYRHIQLERWSWPATTGCPRTDRWRDPPSQHAPGCAGPCRGTH